ncbi:MAG: hypothetical protein PQ612_01775 [Rickettsiales bacterium]|nr:hypothetical protein [Pseudomonadota bacterium]MDA0965353.1 hypothetical protein [Pseudomonadota bacterium]MDG4544281.1 hypothetical protein [Rickettsiales bacterium]MDG4544873.1 hypothetical protein [Rickettsiales bacterium]MDG4546996.1 hypothetical protein [Rickettsiales bacterium]
MSRIISSTLLCALVFLQTGCIGCFFPPTAKVKIEVPESIRTEDLFKIVQESSIGTIYRDLTRTRVWIENRTVYNLEDGIMEIGKIENGGLNIKAERKNNGKTLIVYLGGVGPYCKDMLEPEKKILKLSDKIKENILKN